MVREIVDDGYPIDGAANFEATLDPLEPSESRKGRVGRDPDMMCGRDRRERIAAVVFTGQIEGEFPDDAIAMPNLEGRVTTDGPLTGRAESFKLTPAAARENAIDRRLAV